MVKNISIYSLRASLEAGLKAFIDERLEEDIQLILKQAHERLEKDLKWHKQKALEKLTVSIHEHIDGHFTIGTNDK